MPESQRVRDELCEINRKLTEINNNLERVIYAIKGEKE